MLIHQKDARSKQARFVTPELYRCNQDGRTHGLTIRHHHLMQTQHQHFTFLHIVFGGKHLSLAISTPVHSIQIFACETGTKTAS